jgi:crotonobetainyl-CoA:carnitine CoA-transferase CaiB-like acyl-CoA transferase
MTNAEASAKGPLAGIKIVDLTAVIMGPYATQIMADLGAEVIKVESPDGDIMRWVGKDGELGMGPIHLNLNRGKEHIALDLKRPEAREILFDLIRDADVFVHAMRPKAIKRLGLDYASIRAVKSDIVYCGAYGFAADGPYGDDPAYDDLIQGLCGIAALGSQLAGEPRFFPTVIADKVCGLTLAYATLAALLHKQRTGEGQQVEVPMLETMVQFLMIEHLGDRTFGPDHSVGYARVMSQLRKPHKTLDGFVCALPYNNKNWRDFFDIVGHPELIDDERFCTQSARSRNYEVLYAMLGDFLSKETTDYWLERLKPAHIPVAPVVTLDKLQEDPHLSAVGLFQQTAHHDGREITAIRSALTFSQTPARMGKPAAPVGTDTVAVLRRHGLSQEQIDGLLAEGVLIQA